jgi:hypothetical protein
MSDAMLMRWLTLTLGRVVCLAGPYALAPCVVGALFLLDASRSSTSLRERGQERELWRFQLWELERQAEHKRLLEIIEAMKPRRDLSLPAEPEEGF